MKKEAKRLRAKNKAKIKSMEETINELRKEKAAAAEQHQNKIKEMKLLPINCRDRSPLGQL